ncbi:Protein kinase domain-containing protein [Fusarium falciforme]|uniref:Protein kinase domain-containing protein n=1 Tax=Fusarium falciforme TaxID=195108 RepID=UPI002301BD9B|nr:Protein kinase domain-containing protein [Fusarium falciforme]WAO86229.1 Protein kinase domain-containing protein [Fusarium falciforme]
MATLQVELSLSLWEKVLIRETNEAFFEELGALYPQETPVSQQWVRNNWSWATQVLIQLRDSCNDLDDEENAIHQKDPHRTWQVLRNKLSSRIQTGTSSDSYSCRSRTRQFLDTNKNLEPLISQQQLPFIASDCIQLTKQDNQDWQSIWDFSKFIKTNHPRLRGLHCSIGDREELEQRFSTINPPQNVEEADLISQKSHGNLEAIEMNMVHEYPAFDVCSMVRTVASYCRQSQINLPEELAHLHRELYSFIDELEYIPISELRLEGDLAQNPVASWLPRKSCPLDHHLFTEEEVFKYCIEARFEFPGYRDQNGIIFEATELDKNQLCKSRKDLSILWNDCGFTFDPAENRIYLLQTRPGIKFRELQKRFSLDTARKYFRMITDAVRLNELQTLESVLQVMDLQDSHLKTYDGLVEIIPFQDISFSEETDDTGHSGAIRFGGWHVPQGARLQNPDGEVIPVALKLVWGSEYPDRDRKKRELKNSIVTLTDAPIASIRLVGITINPKSNETFLVFEKAKGVPAFLDEALLNNGKDWDLITELFRDAADSLKIIHQRKLLHRDIHMGNVMIHYVPCPNDPFDPEYAELVIIDLGEGKDMTSRAWLTPNTYGNADYRAPEVISGRQYSIKSDVFAVGYLMTEILEIRSTKAGDDQVPQVLWNIVASCLQKDPDRRPKAHELAADVERLRDGFFVVPEKKEAAVRGEVVLNGPFNFNSRR